MIFIYITVYNRLKYYKQNPLSNQNIKQSPAMQSTTTPNNPKPSSQPQSTQIKLTDIIRLILQFLQQNNLPSTFKALQQQSRTCLNIINKQHIQQLIYTSKWQALFKQLNYIILSQQTLFDVYQLIVDDLIDKDAFMAAGFVIRKCITVQQKMLTQNKQKILRLEYICENPNQKAMYHKPPTQARREHIINRILKQTYQEVQNNRLLSLITSALKYQASKGLIVPNLSYSLLQGKHKNIDNQAEQLITKMDKILRYNQQTRITAIKISNKGQHIALGGIDGLIQIYQPIDYTLDTSTLKYQAQGIMLFHDNSIQHLSFNQTDQMLTSIDNKGIIKIWNMQSGRLLRKIQHQTPVGSCIWGIDSSQILIGYQNIQLYGIRSCNILKQYICSTQSNMNQQYLLDMILTYNQLQGHRLVTFGQAGTIRVFNYKTQQQIKSININRNISSQIVKIIHTKNKENDDIFYICMAKFVITLNQALENLNKYQITGSGDNVELVNIVFAKNYVYECIKKQDGKYVLQARDMKTGRILNSKGIDAGAAKMELHKFRNLLIIYGRDQVLSFWRP